MTYLEDGTTTSATEVISQEQFQSGAYFRSLTESLSARTKNILRREGVHSAATFWMLSPDGYIHLRGVGVTTLEELKALRSQIQADFSLSPTENWDQTVDFAEDGGIRTEFERRYSNLSARAQHALRRACLDSPHQLICTTRDELASLHAVGRQTLEEILDLRTWLRYQPGYSEYQHISEDPLQHVRAFISSCPISLGEEVVAAIISSLPRRLRTAGSLLATDTLANLFSVACAESTRKDLAECLLSIFETLESYLCQAISPSALPTALTAHYGSASLLPDSNAGRAANMLCQAFLHDKSSGRVQTIFLKRMGLTKPGIRTLEEIASELSITRERVRQLEIRAHRLINARPDLLAAVYRQLRALILALGGTAPIDVAMPMTFETSACVSETGRCPLLGLLQNHDLWHDFDIMVDKASRFLSLRGATTHFTAASYVEQARDVATDILGFEYWSTELSAAAQRIRDLTLIPEIERAEDLIIARLLEASGDVRLVGTEILSLRLWKLKQGKLSEQVPEILHRAARPMHFTEVYSESARWNPDREGSERAVFGTLERDPDVLLWDNGTYVLRQHILVPYELLTRIASWLNERLTSNVPYVSVAGAYEAFRDECQSANIPGPKALYSCLKLLEHDMDLREYPYVRREGDTSKRLPVPIILEQFLIQAGGAIPRSALTTYMSDDLGISTQLIPVHMYDIPGALLGATTVVHISNLPVQAQLMDRLLAYCRGRLSEEGHFSVKLLEQEKPVLLAEIGIEDLRLLHSAIVYLSLGAIEGEYPQLKEPSLNSIDSISDAIIEYLDSLARPVSFEELRKVFVAERGYREGTVLGIHNHPAVCRYAPTTVVSLRTLGWDPLKALDLVDVFSAACIGSVKRGVPGVRIQDVLDTRDTDLPPLNGAMWTDTLAWELLRRSGQFALLGEAKSFVRSLSTTPVISSLDELLAYVLKSYFPGVAKLSDFNEYCYSIGLTIRPFSATVLSNCPSLEWDEVDIWTRKLT